MEGSGGADGDSRAAAPSHAPERALDSRLVSPALESAVVREDPRALAPHREKAGVFRGFIVCPVVQTVTHPLQMCQIVGTNIRCSNVMVQSVIIVRCLALYTTGPVLGPSAGGIQLITAPTSPRAANAPSASAAAPSGPLGEGEGSAGIVSLAIVRRGRDLPASQGAGRASIGKGRHGNQRPLEWEK